MDQLFKKDATERCLSNDAERYCMYQMYEPLYAAYDHIKSAISHWNLQIYWKAFQQILSFSNARCDRLVSYCPAYFVLARWRRALWVPRIQHCL